MRSRGYLIGSIVALGIFATLPTFGQDTHYRGSGGMPVLAPRTISELRPTPIQTILFNDATKWSGASNCSVADNTANLPGYPVTTTTSKFTCTSTSAYAIWTNAAAIDCRGPDGTLPVVRLKYYLHPGVNDTATDPRRQTAFSISIGDSNANFSTSSNYLAWASGSLATAVPGGYATTNAYTKDSGPRAGWHTAILYPSKNAVTGAPSWGALKKAIITLTHTTTDSGWAVSIASAEFLPRMRTGQLAVYFDDCFTSQYQAGVDMAALGLKATYAVCPKEIIDADPSYMTLTQLQALHGAGHFVIAHPWRSRDADGNSINHYGNLWVKDFTSYPDLERQNYLRVCDWLSHNGFRDGVGFLATGNGETPRDRISALVPDVCWSIRATTNYPQLALPDPSCVLSLTTSTTKNNFSAPVESTGTIEDVVAAAVGGGTLASELFHDVGIAATDPTAAQFAEHIAHVAEFVDHGLLQLVTPRDILNGCYTAYTAPTSVDSASASITVGDSAPGTTFDNVNATGTQTYTLPAAARGLAYRFVVSAAQRMHVQAAAGERICYHGLNLGLAGSNTVGSSLTLVAKPWANGESFVYGWAALPNLVWYSNPQDTDDYMPASGAEAQSWITNTAAETRSFILPDYATMTALHGWLANHAYAAGDIVAPTTATGFLEVCVIAGTSGGTEPSPWGTSAAATTTDGTVVWMAMQESYTFVVTGSAFEVHPDRDNKFVGAPSGCSDNQAVTSSTALDWFKAIRRTDLDWTATTSAATGGAGTGFAKVP